MERGPLGDPAPAACAAVVAAPGHRAPTPRAAVRAAVEPGFGQGCALRGTAECGAADARPVPVSFAGPGSPWACCRGWQLARSGSGRRLLRRDEVGSGRLQACPGLVEGLDGEPVV